MDWTNYYTRWQMQHIFTIFDKIEPHLACILYDTAKADDRLHKSELICATYLMKQGMRMDALGQHKVIPVCGLQCTRSYSFAQTGALILILG